MYTKVLTTGVSTANLLWSEQMSNRLVIVVSGGLTSNGRGRLASTLEDHVRELKISKRENLVVIVKSMVDAGAMVREFVSRKSEKGAHTSVAVIIITNEALEMVNRQ